MNLRTLGLGLCLIGLCVPFLETSAQKGRSIDIPFYDRCEDSGSYTEIWAKQDRHKVASSDARRKQIAAMSQEDRERSSDFETFPNLFQTCGMGFYEGLGKVRKNGKVGFIDRSGKIVIPLKFVDATRFSEGLAGVELENGKWGFIDRTGKLVVGGKFDWALTFNEGRAPVRVGEKWGYIGKTGRIIIPARFEHAWSFSEGLAAVQKYGKDPDSGGEDVLLTDFVDRSGRLVIAHRFGREGRFVGGKAMISRSVKHPEKGGHYTACFWIDKSGKIISEELDSCSGGPRRPPAEPDLEVIWDYDYRVGYKRSDGKVIWPPAK